MKKLLILLFGVLVGLPALSQIEYKYVHDLDVFSFRVSPSAPLNWVIPKGIVYLPTYIMIEGIDTTKAQRIRITVEPVALTLKETVNNGSIQGNSRVTYTGAWGVIGNATYTQNFLNKDFAYTNIVTASFKFQFTGKKVEVILEGRNNHGTARINIRRGTLVMQTASFDMYKNTTANEPLSFVSNEFAQGIYDVEVIFESGTVERNSMVFDGFRVYE